MAKSVPEKITFLSEEIESLKARIGNNPNAVQRSKLTMMLDMQRDYQSALNREIERRNAGAA